MIYSLSYQWRFYDHFCTHLLVHTCKNFPKFIPWIKLLDCGDFKMFNYLRYDNIISNVFVSTYVSFSWPLALADFLICGQITRYEMIIHYDLNSHFCDHKTKYNFMCIGSPWFLFWDMSILAFCHFALGYFSYWVVGVNYYLNNIPVLVLYVINTIYNVGLIFTFFMVFFL